jgi:hypothetical protein
MMRSAPSRLAASTASRSTAPSPTTGDGLAGAAALAQNVADAALTAGHCRPDGLIVISTSLPARSRSRPGRIGGSRLSPARSRVARPPRTFRASAPDRIGRIQRQCLKMTRHTGHDAGHHKATSTSSFAAVGAVGRPQRDARQRSALRHGRSGRGDETEPSEPQQARIMSAPRRGRGNGQEVAAFTSSTTFPSTAGLHFLSAYEIGHMSPSSRFAASWKPRVEYRYLNLPASWKKTTTLPSAFA